MAQLQVLMDHRDPKVRQEAALELARLDDLAAGEAMCVVASHPDSILRFLVRRELRALLDDGPRLERLGGEPLAVRIREVLELEETVTWRTAPGVWSKKVFGSGWLRWVVPGMLGAAGLLAGGVWTYWTYSTRRAQAAELAGRRVLSTGDRPADAGPKQAGARLGQASGEAETAVVVEGHVRGWSRRGPVLSDERLLYDVTLREPGERERCRGEKRLKVRGLPAGWDAEFEMVRLEAAEVLR
ncbi:MAG: hypothetical protein HY303_13125 [Candidatus Wallbacteria bacterium]|nr:hypothetical protein [Candidatus Wallbacteria bacterium]